MSSVIYELSSYALGFVVDENTNNKAFDEIHSKIAEKIEEVGSVNLLCELKEDFHIPFKSFITDMKFKIKHSQKIDKMAILTKEPYIKQVMEVNGLISHTRFKTFSPEERQEALNWISK